MSAFNISYYLLFPPLQLSDSFLILLFYSSHFFTPFHYQQGTLFNAKFYPYIPAVYYYHFTLLEFFKLLSVGGLSLGSEGQQILGLQDSSQQWCSLYDLDSFSDFQFLHSLFQAFGYHSNLNDHNWYHIMFQF